ncbi:hypothetical protein I552_4723 [Mycobacterium xenopi 3993]|nr:hypothetical protein I552_4723 [Mycobacterium xenopi 3993]
MPDTLITAAEALKGIRVDSLRPHTGCWRRTVSLSYSTTSPRPVTTIPG